MIAKAVIDKKDSGDAVERVLNGEKPTKQKNVAVSNASNKKKAVVNGNTKQVNNANTKQVTNANTRTKTLQKETKSDTKPKIKREASPLRPTIEPTEILDTSTLNGSTSKPSSASDNRDNDTNGDKADNDIVNGNATNEEIIVQNARHDEPTTPRPQTAAKSAMRINTNTANGNYQSQ